MNQMRILHICQRDDSSTGGAVRVAVDLVVHLNQIGWDAHCLFVYGDKNTFGEKLGSRAHYLKLGNSADVLRSGLQLRSFIRSFQPSILHHHDGLLWTYLLTLGLPIKKITHAHVAGGVRSFGYRTVLSNRVQRFSTDLLVCISEHTRDTWLEEGYKASNTCVIPNGVDRTVFYPGTDQQKRAAKERFGIDPTAMTVGFVGRLHSIMKGTDDYLRVIAQLPKNYWGLVVGAGQDEFALKNLAKELGISDRVAFVGPLQEATVGYHAMDVLAFTSHFEHFGLVVLEAMACKVPVVGFSCPGGIEEILTNETGIVIAERDISSMAKAITLVTSDQNDHGIRLAENAFTEISKRFDWPAITASLAAEYKKLLN